MKYRLLVALKVFDFLQTLPRDTQLRVRRRLKEMEKHPSRFLDYHEQDASGRLLDVHVHAGVALYYWEDFADRHVKVMDVRLADTPG